jgi:hypothetical protein
MRHLPYPAELRDMGQYLAFDTSSYHTIATECFLASAECMVGEGKKKTEKVSNDSLFLGLQSSYV